MSDNLLMDYNQALSSGNVLQAYNMMPDSAKAQFIAQQSSNQTPAPQQSSPIMDSVQSILQGVSDAPVSSYSVPPLNFQMPSGADLSAKWQEFIKTASQSPDLVNYYKQLYDAAQGDLNLAKDYIERGYQMGVRQTGENLQGSLESLGLTSKGETNKLMNDLNQRGIALTQEQGQQPVVAGGGQAGSEMGDLQQSQTLRKEAEMRSARQSIEGAGLRREQQLTTAGQNAKKAGLQIQGQEQQDIMNRASQSYGVYQQGLNADLVNAQMKQNNAISGGGGGGSTPGKGDINPSTGKAYAVNPSSGVWDDNYFSKTYG